MPAPFFFFGGEMKRTVKNFGDMRRWFASESGARYRGYTQKVEPIKEHIRYLNHKVNEAPASGNKAGWSYVGSIPMTMVIDWCTKTKTPFDVWARNEGGAKDKFIAWLKSEHPQLMPKTGAKARPSIAVPTTYKSRAKA
jgi:hypothetical protein